MRKSSIQFKLPGLIALSMLLANCAGLLGPDVKPGVALYEAGKYSESLAHYESIIESGEANGQVYRLAYESAFKAGKRVTAGKYYKSAITSGFEEDSMKTLATNLWYDRALSTMGKNEWKSGQKAADMVQQFAPGSVKDKFCIKVLEGKKKFDRGAHKGLWDAVSDYSEAATYDPSSGLPYFLMGQARYKNNRTDYDAALEDYYESIKIEPDGTFVKQARADIKKIEAVKKKMNAFWGK